MSLAVGRSTASKNLIDTYCSIGLGLAGAVVERRQGFLCCHGPIPHPACNFAIDLDLDITSTGDLREIASMCHAFRVYVLPGDSPAWAPSLLMRNGFLPSHELAQMTADGAQTELDLIPTEAKTGIGRARVGDFMAEQFFSSQPRSFRHGFALATAHANGSLFSVGHEAALMLCEDDSCIGVYNLCVAPSLRGRGIGSQLIDWVRNLSFERGKQITLQCHSPLVAWYETLGFSKSGSIQVFDLPK